MVDLTSEAAKVLKETLEETGLSPQKALRLSFQDSLWTLDVDTPRERDRVIRYQDAAVIIIAPSVEAAAGSAIIDLQDKAGSIDLVLRRRISG